MLRILKIAQSVKLNISKKNVSMMILAWIAASVMTSTGCADKSASSLSSSTPTSVSSASIGNQPPIPSNLPPDAQAQIEKERKQGQIYNISYAKKMQELAKQHAGK